MRVDSSRLDYVVLVLSTCIGDDSTNDRHKSDEEKDAWPKPVIVPQHCKAYQEDAAWESSPQSCTRSRRAETRFTSCAETVVTFLPMSTSWFNFHSSSFISYIGSTLGTVPISFLHVLPTRWTIRQINTPFRIMNTIRLFLTFVVALVAFTLSWRSTVIYLIGPIAIFLT